MSYELDFHPKALAEFKKLDRAIAEQFKTKLKERLISPRVPSATVSGGTDLYKIKLRTVGYRLVYQVQDEKIVVLVLSVGKRERNAAYKAALGRLA
ncbi:MAG: type II toxin-antitoxin system RelE/ParE family toxin [Paludibacterium sp.]|uniref:type II toxin-antitoxin system RelE family toxin n=1 Tax=Paludibacterium sp. TaxID=1917523 RepID=UPI0025E64815|nr:type II toxin-antitoxin system RelE/ParE family toxin [Paludibacterium sp.]MBV8049154.1 type II toxin-antitoxin system RelE/ParE family toxin [Paludibacterium sp.]MBV8649679.1 type II toxin-antitoxin system RelE/ParE family toxin [Paludibacterium sp.]